MKSIFILFAIFAISVKIIFAQNFTEVVKVENKNAEQIYFSVKEWVALNFKSANDVIQLDDATNKKLICKGTTQIFFEVSKVKTFYYLSFTMIIEARDGRYKQDISANYYTSEAGIEISPEQIKELTTEEGVKAYYKSIGVGAFATKKAVQDIIESNKSVLAQTDSALQQKLSDLKAYITSGNQQADW